MKSFIVACLVAFVSAEAEPEPYTIAQAHALGLGVHAVNPAVTYTNAAINPFTYTNAAINPFTYTNAGVAPVTYAAGLHAPLVHAAKSAPCVNAANEPVACAHGVHYIGKREAEAEADAEADPLTYLTYGAGLHTPAVTYAGIHAPAVTYAAGVNTPYTYAAGLHAPAVTYAAGVAPVTYAAGLQTPFVYAAKSAPCVNAANDPVECAHGVHNIGKREAEAEAEPYTLGQVLTGQVAPGSVVKSINYGHGTATVPATLTSAPAVTYKAAVPAVTYKAINPAVTYNAVAPAHAVTYARAPAFTYTPTVNYAHTTYANGLPYYV